MIGGERRINFPSDAFFCHQVSLSLTRTILPNLLYPTQDSSKHIQKSMSCKWERISNVKYGFLHQPFNQFLSLAIDSESFPELA